MTGSPRSNPPPAKAERRRSRRTSVGWHARVLIDQNPGVECAVLNVSERGARLRLRHPVDLPGGFVLSISRFGELKCEMVEQAQAVVRVGFIDPPEKVRAFFRGQLPALAADDDSAA
jgi:hypothetical protein